MEQKAIFLKCAMGSIVLLSVLSGHAQKNGDKPDTVGTEIQYADIPNARIAYKSYGSGEPLVMCIGFATNMDQWSTEVIVQLQKKYQVIVFDYRGMGLSTNTDTAFTIHTLAEDLDALLEALKIRKAHVLGWSMGGFVAQMFAVKHPEKVQQLVLYATNCGDTLRIDPSEEIVEILSNPKSTPMQMLSTLFPDDWLASHTKPWTVLPEATEPTQGITIGMQYGAIQQWLTPGGGSATQLKKLKMPVLVICGDQDKVCPSSNSDLLAKAISKSTLIKVTDSGHGLMYQLPDVFAGHVLDFLK
jgi:pimeloyl-ACP methyl ester carboxylesterase